MNLKRGKFDDDDYHYYIIVMFHIISDITFLRDNKISFVPMFQIIWLPKNTRKCRFSQEINDKSVSWEKKVPSPVFQPLLLPHGGGGEVFAEGPDKASQGLLVEQEGQIIYI